MKKTIGIILIFSGIALLSFAVVRGFYYAPNDLASTDSGLTLSGEVTSSTATATATTQSNTPVQLLIPKLGIDAKVQSLGLTKKGNMAAPNNFIDVSWFKLGTLPGEVGSAVMSGHEDNAATLDGVFKHLDQLSIGDDIYVVAKDGTKLHFRVTDKQIYPYDKSPVDQIFATADKARLNLITCAGEWLPTEKTNDKRLVIYTELVK